jgi:hypothetical protein
LDCAELPVFRTLSLAFKNTVNMRKQNITWPSFLGYTYKQEMEIPDFQVLSEFTYFRRNLHIFVGKTWKIQYFWRSVDLEWLDRIPPSGFGNPVRARALLRDRSAR